ncbi:MAG: signal recognition particle protein [Oligoflexales bacterium]
MLDILSDGFKEAKLKLKGQASLTEEVIDDAMGVIRKSLLDADVEYGVVKVFLERVKTKAVGQIVQLKAGKGDSKRRVSPSDHFTHICQTELENLMGPVDSSLNLPKNRPATIMMVGLQGSGKTTTTGKLTRYLVDKHGRKPLLVGADTYRPAATDQLKVLADRVGVPSFTIPGATPVEICKKAVAEAYRLDCDAIIYDTAGRLAIDEVLMQELRDIKAATNPDNILFVCDSMMGQDAVGTARAFDESLGLGGIIMTKLDGDARGGAALSIKEITGKPIKFLGMGEDLSKLEEFRPQGLASRILGMGDVVGLMEDFQKVAHEDQEEQALRMLQGQFTYRDFYTQIETIQKMGSLKDVVAKMPMQNMIPAGAQLDDKELVKIKAIIDSMTNRERLGMDSLNPSRVKRIARGAGRPEKDINELSQKFQGMKKMMGMLGQNMGFLGKIPGLKQLGQLKNLAQMGKMAAAGGMPGMGGMMNPFGGGDVGAGGARRPVDRDKQRKMRKAAKKARKKNRK